MHRIKCAEIWGGIKNEDLDVCTAGLSASLYSSSCEGSRGGDAYYFSVCGSDKLTRLALADVVGHGERVALVSQWVYDQLEAHMNDLDQPGFMAAMNHSVIEHGFDALTTAVVVSYYLSTRKLYFNYAGHPPLLCRRRSGDWCELTLTDSRRGANLPFGVIDEATYDTGEAPLETGDRLVLFSDGFFESPDRHGEQFGRARMLACLDDLEDADPMTLKTGLLNRLREWTASGLTHDDVTIIAIQLS